MPQRDKIGSIVYRGPSEAEKEFDGKFFTFDKGLAQAYANRKRDGTRYENVSAPIPLKLPKRHFHPEVRVIDLSEAYLENNGLIKGRNSEPLLRTNNVIYIPGFGFELQDFFDEDLENFSIEYTLQDNQGRELKVENQTVLPPLVLNIPENWRGRVVHVMLYLQDADGTVYRWKTHNGFVYQ